MNLPSGLVFYLDFKYGKTTTGAGHEGFGTQNSGVIKRKSIKESASTAVSSTKPSKESRKVISEETKVADRFRKLAGLL